MRIGSRSTGGSPVIRYFLLTLGAVLLTSRAFADVVVPTDDVTSRVIVRASASAQSDQVGSLRPGEQAELVGVVPNWHRVQLSNGTQGFVRLRLGCSRTVVDNRRHDRMVGNRVAKRRD